MTNGTDRARLPELAEKIEIEFKWLLERKPDLDHPILADADIWEIKQLYLVKGEQGRPRLRRVCHNGEERYYLTIKDDHFGLARIERESEISKADWKRLSAERDPQRAPIEKTRYLFRYEGRLWELDKLHSPVELWLLELEVEDEQDKPDPPEIFGPLRDVSDDPAYRNAQIAKRAAA